MYQWIAGTGGHHFNLFQCPSAESKRGSPDNAPETPRNNSMGELVSAVGNTDEVMLYWGKKCNLDVSGKTTAEKLSLLRQFRQAQYEKLKDAVYQRRGWTKDGIPTVEKVRNLGIDFPEVLELLKANGVR